MVNGILLSRYLILTCLSFSQLRSSIDTNRYIVRNDEDWNLLGTRGNNIIQKLNADSLQSYTQISVGNKIIQAFLWGSR